MFFQVSDVSAFVARHAELAWLDEPTEIPDGWAAAFTDPAGNTIHLFDTSGVSEVS